MQNICNITTKELPQHSSQINWFTTVCCVFLFVCLVFFYSNPLHSHFFGDTSDDSEGEGHLKKTARGPAKPSLQPSAPVIPPPPCRVQNSNTVAPPPPTTLRMEHRRPAEEQSPSERQVYRPTWRGGRRGSDTIACSGEQYLKQQGDANKLSSSFTF